NRMHLSIDGVSCDNVVHPWMMLVNSHTPQIIVLQLIPLVASGVEGADGVTGYKPCIKVIRPHKFMALIMVLVGQDGELVKIIVTKQIKASCACAGSTEHLSYRCIADGMIRAK